MNLIENAELVDYEMNDEKILFVLIKDSFVYEITFNFKRYDKLTKGWVNSAEQEENVKNWCEKYLGTDMYHLEDCIGNKYNIYQYDKFNSFWESQTNKYDKLDPMDKGKNITCFIENVLIDDYAITFELRYNDKLYKSTMKYSVYMASRKKLFIDESKRDRQFKKFNNAYEEFGAYVVSKDDYDFEGLIGHKAKCEIRAMKNGDKSFAFLQINAVI